VLAWEDALGAADDRVSLTPEQVVVIRTALDEVLPSCFEAQSGFTVRIELGQILPAVADSLACQRRSKVDPSVTIES
jgi:hypothetical protein